MQISFASYSHANYASRCPREPGPDDVYDPDQPDRSDSHDGPDDVSDPDTPSRGGDSYNGPDGAIDYPLF